MPEYIDLHVHTNISDGSMSPEEIMELAYKKGLKAIAITDHDITIGVERAVKCAEKYGIEVIPGVEISVDYESRYGYKKFHMLGYFIDTKSKELYQGLEFLRVNREKRNKKILIKLNELGVEISEEELKKISGEGITGRIHFAYLLKKKGYASNMQNAFEKYIGSNCPAYFNRERLKAEEAIKLIKNAGGMPIIAHPKDIRETDENKIVNIISDLKKAGMIGIECYYWEHNSKEEKFYLKIAQDNGLLISGGTDFHGLYRDYVSLGTGLGNLKIPYGLVEEMKKTIL